MKLVTIPGCALASVTAAALLAACAQDSVTAPNLTSVPRISTSRVGSLSLARPAPPSPPSSPGGSAYASCKELHEANPLLGDGVYTIEPIAGSPIDVHCLMSADGGGWTLAGNFPWPGNTAGVAGWTSGDQVGSSFTNLALPFKLSDSLINTLKTEGYRAHGTASQCLDGPCSIDTTLYWKATCNYSSNSLGSTCGVAYIDAQFTSAVAGVSDSTPCGWHWGLVASDCAVVSGLGTSHGDDHVFVGELNSYVHAFDGREGEDPSIQFWVK